MVLKVSDLAREARLSPDAIRFYEREGLLPEPPRSGAGYRLYDPGILHRLRFIKGAQAMGLKLSEIRELLEIQDKGACPCGHTRTIVERRITEIDAEMARLSQIRHALAEMAALDCPATEDSELWACEATFVARGSDTDGRRSSVQNEAKGGSDVPV